LERTKKLTFVEKHAVDYPYSQAAVIESVANESRILVYFNGAHLLKDAMPVFFGQNCLHFTF